jgi:hypothetical protein
MCSARPMPVERRLSASSFSPFARRQTRARKGIQYLFRDVTDGRQYPKYVQEAIVVVLALDGAAGVAFRQRLEDLRGDEFGAEQRRRRVGGGSLESHCEVVKSSRGCQCVSVGEDAL